MDVIGQYFSALEVLFSNTPFAIFFIFLIAVLANVIPRLTERKPMRRITAFDGVVAMTGASIESNRPLHVSLGSGAIGDNTTLVSLLSSEFIYYMSREVAIGDTPPIFTVSEGVTLPLAADTLRRAYEHENRLYAYNGSNVLGGTPISARWYPTGQRSLAFASALMTMQVDDQLSGNVLLGRHGIEVGLILDAAYRNRIASIAGSVDLDGQAVAYALADDALIGEELLTASGYLGDDYRSQKRNFAIDVMRTLVVATIIGLVIYNLLGG